MLDRERKTGREGVSEWPANQTPLRLPFFLDVHVRRRDSPWDLNPTTTAPHVMPMHVHMSQRYLALSPYVVLFRLH